MHLDASLPRLPSASRITAVVAAFFCVGLLTYWQSLDNGFVRWDDSLLITENPIVQRITPANIARMFTTYDPELYIPLTFVSYALDYAVGGGAPFIFHLHSLFLHIINALLVAWLILLLVRDGRVAVLAGLLFLLHPLHVEATAWASGRKDLLAIAFCLASIVSYLYYRRDGGRAPYILSIVLFVFALLSKVVVITLPVLLLLLDDLMRRPWKEAGRWPMLLDKIPYVALSAIFGVIAVLGKTQIIATTSLLDKVLMAMKSTVFYLHAFVWPTSLSVLYPYLGRISPANPDFWVPTLIVIAIFAAVCWLRRYSRVPFVAFLFFLVAVAPTFVNFAKGDLDLYFASDRYAYLPSVGLILLVAFGVALLASSRIRYQAALSAGAVVCLVFAFLAHRQSLVWKDTEMLFTHVISLYPGSYVAHANLGNAYRRQKRYQDAIAAFERSLEIRRHARTLSNLGAVHRLLGDLPKAEAAYVEALELDPTLAVVHFGKGILLQAQGDDEGALASYDRALELDPGYEEAYVNKGSLLLERGDTDGAIEAYRKAIALNPFIADAHYNLGVLYGRLKRLDDAIASYRQAISLDPLSLSPRLNLGLVLYNSGDRDGAIEQFRAVLQIDPKNKTAQSALRQMGE